MNAAGTMARVYQTLKARVMAGEFAPGERIDPARLSAELAASATPIRDALHRLAGERLVETWQHEGFRQPIVTEADLRDLYTWSDELVRLVLRAVERRPALTRSHEPGEPGLPPAIALFDWLGTLSVNHEHRAAMMSLNDRCYALRMLEGRVLEPVDPAPVIAAITAGRYADARRWFARYHAARQRRITQLAAQFRPREPS